MMRVRFSLQLFRQIAKAAGITLLMSSALFASSAYAISFTLNGVPDAATMLINLTSAVPNLMRLVTAIAYVMGFSFVAKGLFALKQFGESRTMMSSQHELKPALIYLAVGAMLIFLVSSVQTGLSTFWNNPTPYAYINTATDQWSQLTNGVFMIIQLVGTIAFIRGLIILTHLGGHHGSQPGTFSKALAHIIAGILCINLYQFLQVIVNTLQIGQLQ